MNILFMSNSISMEDGPQRRFGYSIVATKVANYLQEIGHQIYFLGMQDITSPFKMKNGIINLGVRYDPFCSDICEDYAKTYKADCFLSMLDIWLPQTDYMVGMCQKLKIPWIPHVTLNSEPLTPYIGNKLHSATMIIAPSKYNSRLLHEGGLGVKSVYLPHGVDLDVFKIMPDIKDEMKKRLGIEDKKFVAAIINRNKGMQKRLTDAMRVWAIVCANDPQFKKDAVLLMVHDPIEPEGFRTDMYRDKLQMVDNIKFVWNKPNADGVDMMATFEGDREGMKHNANISLPPTEIAKILNICDVTIVPSQGESFCLPAVESLACGTPVIMGNHSVGKEHVGDSKGGLLVDIAYNEITPLLSEVMNMNVHSFADAIYKMYKDEDFRRECGKNGVKYAQTLGWDKVLPMWKKAFEMIEKERMTVNYQHGKMGL